jgi:hypothetical protein
VKGIRCCLRLCLASFYWAYSFAAAQSPVREITIHSHWGGLGTPQDETITIPVKRGRLERDGKRIEKAKVDALIAALNAPLVSAPDSSNLGITPAWIDKQIADQKGRFRIEVARATPNQRVLLTSTLKDPAKITRILPALFSTFHTDDYPAASVEVIFDDGSRLKAETRSQYAFMIPWRVGSKGETYNADVSRAVANLLSRKSPNRNRLAGSTFAYELVEATRRTIEPDWNLLGSQDLAGDALSALQTVYEVVASEIHPSHHPEYGTATYKGEPQQMNLHATLRRASFPSGVSISLVLEQIQGRVPGIDRFLTSVGKYERLALSIPWLNKYMAEHPRVPVRLSYVQDSSFGNKGFHTFAEDMNFRDRQDLVDQVRARLQDVALLIVGNTYSESYWLLFPDKHMVLWRFGGPSGLLKWTANDFSAGECADYKTNFGGCSGREVTPDGELASERAPRDQGCMASNLANGTAVAGDEPLFPVEDRGRGGFIDKNGRVVIPLCFDAVGDFSEGLARFKRDNKWGYVDKRGAVVIEPSFQWAQEFSEGLARVQVSGLQLGQDAKWGFIDKTGAIVIDERRDTSAGEHNNIGSDNAQSAFHDGLALFDLGGKKGYIDKAGKVVIPPQFTYAYPFSEGKAAVTKDGSGDTGWGHIDKTGMWVIQPNFQWASSFNEGLAPVNRTKDCGYVDERGTLVLQPKVSPGEIDCATVWGDFVNGLARWKFGKKYGFIHRTGKTVIEPKFDLTFHFSEGLAAVMIGGKWGYIDTSGKIVIQPMPLMRAEDFHNGLAFVSTKDGKYGYIDRTGKFIWTPTLLYKN